MIPPPKPGDLLLRPDTLAEPGWTTVREHGVCYRVCTGNEPSDGLVGYMNPLWPEPDVWPGPERHGG